MVGTANTLSIVAAIPAYNEENTIAKIVIQCQKHVDKVMVCDDGSEDLTGEIAERLGAIVIRHEKNKGKGVAIQDLFKNAKELEADVVVTLDADLQHDPNDIPELLRPILSNDADIVIGSRSASYGMPSHRKAGNRIVNSLTNILAGRKLSTDSQSGFRAYSKKALHTITVTERSMGVESQTLIQASEKNLRIFEVPISARYGGVRDSKLNPVTHMLRLLTFLYSFASQRKPMLYLGVPGVILIIVGVVFGVRVLEIFSRTGLIAVGSALLAVGLTVLGVLMSLTAFILEALLRVLRRSD